MEEQTFESFDPVDAPEKKSNTGLIIAIVVIALLLCCCCVILVGVGWGYGDQLMDLFSQALPLLLAG